MVKFKQLIRPGQRGRDVRAVKRAMLAMGVPGSGGLGKTNKAGPKFVECLKHIQKTHGQHVDGVYGKNSHKIIAPHFDAYGRLLYRTARRRNVHVPEATNMSAQAAAKQLVKYHSEGKFRDDSGRVMAQVQATAAGKAVWSQMGRYVFIDKRIMEALVELIDKGFHVGCFAMCSDHPYDGLHGHAGGHAVDISSVNGISVAAPGARQTTLGLAEHLHSKMPATLHPWQEICDGYGYQHDAAISACTIPGAGFYGYTAMSQHRNHVHLGYYG